jgi:hypothetical protein
MHEELVAPDEEQIPTQIDKVMVLSTGRFRSYHVTRHLADWINALDHGHVDGVLDDFEHLFPTLRVVRRSTEIVRPAAASQ